MEKQNNTSAVTATYQVNQLSSMTALAGELANFIKSQKLSKQINGKQYVFCEGWTYAGSALGLLPAVVSCENIGSGKEIKYKACVELINVNTGKTVGRAFAICSNQESGKQNYAEFAIASTAMTRATGKAYRLPLGWLMKAAGYESCNAEEMDYDQAPVKKSAKVEEKENNDMPDRDRKAITDIEAQEAIANLATVKQKTKLILLLNSDMITKEERNKMIEKINKLDWDRMEKAIANVQAKIDERLKEKNKKVA